MRKSLKALLLAAATAMPALAQDAPKVSILGDSYSTFENYLTPDTNAVWYVSGSRALRRTDVTRVEETWWWQLIEQKGWKLERNNSYSGATVCNTGYRGEDYTHESFVTRAANLGTPDVILVFGGTNDSWAGSPIGDFNYGPWAPDDLYSFRPAMACLLDTLKRMHPDAALFAISNDGLKTEITASMDSICRHYGVTMIQLEGIDKTNGHPNRAGMRSIAEQVGRAIDLH